MVDQRDGGRDASNLWMKFSPLDKAGDPSPTPEVEIIRYL